jgi:hypothetical protein
MSYLQKKLSAINRRIQNKSPKMCSSAQTGGQKKELFAKNLLPDSRVARWFIFKPKYVSQFGKFWRALECKMLVYFMTVLNILRPFGINYGRLV